MLSCRASTTWQFLTIVRQGCHYSSQWLISSQMSCCVFKWLAITWIFSWSWMTLLESFFMKNLTWLQPVHFPKNKQNYVDWSFGLRALQNLQRLNFININLFFCYRIALYQLFCCFKCFLTNNILEFKHEQ